MLDNAEATLQAEVEVFKKIPAVDSILEVICRITGMGFAAVARVTEKRWVACAVKDNINFGLIPGGELDISTTICQEIEQNKQTVVIDHVATDKVYAHHHTPLLYGFQSYISTPITLSGNRFFGTLCAIDPNPALLNTPETLGMFKLFADLIAFHLNALEQIELTTIDLIEEQKTSELRDQFIAILGHDLRNPVGAIRNSAQLLLRMPLDDRALRLANIIQDSSFRITGLIENVLDFARGRLGEGITLNIKENAALEATLAQVITELKAIWPNRSIDIEFKLREPVKCDAVRIAQLFSNILGNALTYGKADEPVTVKLLSQNGKLNLSVANCGEKIPDTKMARLFQPFSRGPEENSKDGLGLGLYIASEIARAHHGELSVTSTDEQTCFTLTIDS
ncbi:GAF domain-containing sensor histidine kinase [Pedobacter sp. MC2016-15]|uniref:GAF domain-containing sensor histidine kinase n=1 Tax=Pedobacter sp. MC2016-15 TaxID=2994473 RepID=UPI002246F5BF|nr:GAF domain-containing sensor histidine kinase [Pedobacter sp. MC2016-15]MCX2480585.1 GAF domain-containing sensor histidine kinase [Pedobacter sp. MC2016-15]